MGLGLIQRSCSMTEMMATMRRAQRRSRQMRRCCGDAATPSPRGAVNLNWSLHEVVAISAVYYY